MATRKIKLEDQIGQAKEMLEAGNVDQAIAICRYIFRYYPRCLEVGRILGEAYTEKRWLDEAEQLFVFVLSADPQDVLGYVDRGFVAYERGQLEDAITYYERALELDPSIEQLRTELLRLYGERYKQQRPKLRLTKAGLANRRLRDGYYSQSIDEYLAILRDTPNRLDSQVGLLESYWRNREYVRAESLGLEMLNDNQWLVKANLILWHIYGVRRHLDKAASYLEKARTLDPLNLVAVRLFDDSVLSDNALNYLAMLSDATIPAFDPNVDMPSDELTPDLPDWINSDTYETDLELGFAKPATPGEGVSLSDLGLGNDWIAGLIADTEQQTNNQIQVEQERQQEQERVEALSQLDELRKQGVEDNGEFGGWLEELSENAPSIDLNAATPAKTESSENDLFEVEPFDLDLAKDNEHLFQFFDDLDAAAQTSALSAFNPESIGSEAAIDLPSDVQPFDFSAALQETRPDAPDEASSYHIEQLDLSAETNAYFNQVSSDVPVEQQLDYSEIPGSNFEPFQLEDFALEPSNQPAVVPSGVAASLANSEFAANQQPMALHTFHRRDEQGPVPDFVLSSEYAMASNTSDAFNQEAANVPANVTSLENDRSNKENQQMPIKRGGNDDNDLFDWEREELPDYLSAFAMDQDEAMNVGLATPNSPLADITNPPTSRRPRTGELPAVNDIPAWLNPEPARPAAGGRPNGSPVDLGGSARPSSGGNLPNWLEATEFEDKTPTGSQAEALPTNNFGMDDLQPFSFEGFGSPAPSPVAPPPATPAPKIVSEPEPTPFDSSFLGDDLQPFSLDDANGGFGLPATPPPSLGASRPAAPQPTPPAPQPPANNAFNIPGFDDLGLGDLQPFDPLGGAGPKAAAPMQPAQPPVQPPTQQTRPTSSQPAVPSPSPRPFTPPRTSAPQPANPFADDLGDLGDLQPFNFGEASDESQRMSGKSASTSRSDMAFEPNFPQMPAIGGEGFQPFSLDDVKPFGMDSFGEAATPTRQEPSNNTRPSTPARSPFQGGFRGDSSLGTPGDNFDLPDDLGLDLSPFAPDGFDNIPGIAPGPTKLNNLTTLPDEPFMPSSTRRPRDNEPMAPLEPGQEAPLRAFPWIKSRNQRAKEEQQEQGSNLFQKLAARRKQQSDHLNQGDPNLVSDSEYEHIPSFEEIEQMSEAIESTQQQPTTPPQQPAQPLSNFATENVENSSRFDRVNSALNSQLNMGLDDGNFESLLDTELPGSTSDFDFNSFAKAETSDVDSFEPDFGLEPFDLGDLGGASSLQATPQPEAAQALPTTPAPTPSNMVNDNNIFDFAEFNPQPPTKPTTPAQSNSKFDLEDAAFDNLSAFAPNNANGQTQPDFDFDFATFDKTDIEMHPTSVLPEAPATEDDFFADFKDFGDFGDVNFEKAGLQDQAAGESLPNLDLPDFDMITPIIDSQAAKQTMSQANRQPIIQEPAVQIPVEQPAQPVAPTPPETTQAATTSQQPALPPIQPVVEPNLPPVQIVPPLVDPSLQTAATQSTAPVQPKPPISSPAETFATPSQPQPIAAQQTQQVASELAQQATDQMAAQPIAAPQVTTQPAATPAPEPVAAQQATTQPTQPQFTPQPASVNGGTTSEPTQIDSYLKLVKSDPRNLLANIDLAEAYYQQGQYNQAITYYTGAIRVADKGTLDQLATRLQSILQQPGANPRFHRVLGDVYMKQGQFNVALNEYQLALGPAKR